jgi:hypothetical protein
VGVNSQAEYEGALQRAEEAEEAAYQLKEEVLRLRRAIWTYRDKPGCNSAARANALRRLLHAAGRED